MSTSLFLDLPYDILRLLCSILDGVEVARLLSTCKALHMHYQDEAIWWEQCARHNVHDRALFAGATFFEVYSQVLHTYAPLIGLWASDHPYRGGVIEFRFDASAHGLVGEVWRFPNVHTVAHAFESWQTPKLPEYFTFMSITLPPPPPANAPRRAQLSWHLQQNGAEHFGPGDAFLAVPTLRVLAPTHEALHLHYHAGTCRLPDFPAGAGAPWYDAARGLPRLRVEASPASRALNAALIPAAAFLHMQAGPHAKPAALVVAPGEPGQPEPFRLHEPRLQVQDLRNYDLGGDEPRRGLEFHRRFYPLRMPVLDGDDPADERWRPESLEGIWLGAYASHGTEVLYIYFDAVKREVRAMKITGDLNVPRGVDTWRFSVDNRLRPDELPHTQVEAMNAFGQDLSKVRIYQGEGTISGTGFL